MKLPKHISTKVVVLVLLLAVIGAVGITQALASKDSDNEKVDKKKTPTAEVTDIVSLYTSPSNISSTQGQEFTIEVRVGSGDVSVNGVDAMLTYPTDAVEFVRIDSQNSAFDVGANESGGEGTVSIARGYTGETSGDLLVANVVFRSLRSSGEIDIDVTGDSVVVDSQQFVDVLQETTGTSVQFN